MEEPKQCSELTKREKLIISKITKLEVNGKSLYFVEPNNFEKASKLEGSQ